MKKLLILAYDFPPYVSVGGLRPYSWYKNLKEFGVEPTVITRQWESKFGDERDYVTGGSSNETLIEKSTEGRIFRAPYHPNLSNKLYLKYGSRRYTTVRKLMSGFLEFAQFFLPVGTKRGLYYEARKIMMVEKFDAIIATGDPFVLFHYAQKLSKEFSTPWIADYRDLWSQNIERKKISSLHLLIEKRVIKSTSLVITVNTFLSKQIQKINPNVQIEIIPNGYDADNINLIADTLQKRDIFRIGFAGMIYNWHPWKEVLGSIMDWMAINPDSKIEVNIYGTNKKDEIEAFLQAHSKPLRATVNIYPKLSNLGLLRELAKHNSMLLFNDYSFMGTKIFDYLGLRRQIILCYENDKEALALKDQYYDIEEIDGVSHHLQADLIEKTNAGIIVQDKNHLHKVLNDLYREFSETGKIACNSAGVENYSRKIQVQKLAEIIKQIN